MPHLNKSLAHFNKKIFLSGFSHKDVHIVLRYTLKWHEIIPRVMVVITPYQQTPSVRYYAWDFQLYQRDGNDKMRWDKTVIIFLLINNYKPYSYKMFELYMI